MSDRLSDFRQLVAHLEEETRRRAVAELDTQSLSAEERDALLPLLIEVLGDTSWRVRKEAAALMSAWPDRPKAARALTVALAEPENIGRRNAVVEALIGLGPDAVPPILDDLGQKPEHRKLHVDTLGFLADRRAVPAVRTLLADEDPNVRAASAESLGRIGGPDAEAALLQLLGTDDLLLVLAALDGLNRMGAAVRPEVLRPLLSRSLLRAQIFEALGRAGDAGAVEVLASALGDPARSVREAATLALAELGQRLAGADRPRPRIDDAGMAGLVQALLEGSLGVQRAAAQILGWSGRPEAVRPLALALADHQLRDAAIAGFLDMGPGALDRLAALAPVLAPDLRAEVYGLLPRLGARGEDLRTRLEVALRDLSPDAAAVAATALGDLGDTEAIPALLEALGRDAGVARSAATALSQIGRKHPEALRQAAQKRGMDRPEAALLCRVLGSLADLADAPLLRAGLGAESATVRQAAAAAIGELPPDQNLDGALLFALADEAASVRAQAARSLGRRRATSAVQTLEAATADPEPQVRSAAAKALGACILATSGALRQTGIEVLRRLAQHEDPVVAAPCLELLGRLGGDADLALLSNALGREDAETIKAALRGLGGRTQAIEAMVKLLDDARWDVRRAAVEALAACGSVAHPRLQAKLATERDALVKEALEAALK